MKDYTLDLVIIAVLALLYFLFRKRFHSSSRGMPPFGGSPGLFRPSLRGRNKKKKE